MNNIAHQNPFCEENIKRVSNSRGLQWWDGNNDRFYLAYLVPSSALYMTKWLIIWPNSSCDLLMSVWSSNSKYDNQLLLWPIIWLYGQAIHVINSLYHHTTHFTTTQLIMPPHSSLYHHTTHYTTTQLIILPSIPLIFPWWYGTLCQIFF